MSPPEPDGRPAAERIAIRAVDDGCAPTAAVLLSRFFGEEGFGGDPAAIAANLAAMLEDPSCWAALALLDGEPVGVATVMTMRDIEHGRVGEIGDLYVLPQARGRGAARALVEAAVGWSRGCGCTALLVTITAAGEREHGLGRFYQGLGFALTDRMTARRAL